MGTPFCGEHTVRSKELTAPWEGSRQIPLFKPVNRSGVCIT